MGLPVNEQYDLTPHIERLPDTGQELLAFGAFGVALIVWGLVILRDLARRG